ncbi:LysM peptidoglycan-binding and 3D domain-containing protein [Terrihalobacillus insolitus]|uniref:LysM peptidoglycan-binding and 3D domain-containing protein n=1 Tax=Terrihalobacillus insolitus TaxID=2950438 RepID=UPI0023404832|nr:LysM peptidoglycan-binding and 3D domain-containing protein [Terrihalobacillus insolitus]MDC3414823.1 LysM peptidoglycan-binding domain-containing protein [Terrihalobacillus insolitus]
MKKTIVSLALFLIIAGSFGTTASAKRYQVEWGDSLWEIANTFGTSVDRLKDKNDLRSDLIFSEQLLDIDVEQTYIVEKGDTLSHIALEYDVTVDELLEWNDLDSDLILPEQKLTVFTDPIDSDRGQAVSAEAQAVTSEQTQETLTVTATAYTAECEGCSGITKTGINLNNDRDAKVIAVDPEVIPLGTKVYVEGYGEAIAGDVGSAIVGNRIDINVPTKEQAYDWGVRKVKVTILG